jgi:stage IV sporulation protein FB
MFLMIFNLLPAYPLDGGHTLDAWLGALLGGAWATRIVSVLGLVIAALIGLWSFANAQFFMLFVAFFIGQTNWEALQSVGRWRR